MEGTGWKIKRTGEWSVYASGPQSVVLRPLQVPETLSGDSCSQNYPHNNTKLSFACATVTLMNVGRVSQRLLDMWDGHQIECTSRLEDLTDFD